MSSDKNYKSNSEELAKQVNNGKSNDIYSKNLGYQGMLSERQSKEYVSIRVIGKIFRIEIFLKNV